MLRQTIKYVVATSLPGGCGSGCPDPDRMGGDDPDREGLVDTPDRVVRAYDEFFAGYHEDPVEILATTFRKLLTTTK